MGNRHRTIGNGFIQIQKLALPTKWGPNVIRRTNTPRSGTLGDWHSRSLPATPHFSGFHRNMCVTGWWPALGPQGRKEGEITRRKCWVIWVSEIFVAWTFLETTYNALFRYNLAQYDWVTFLGLLVIGGRGTEECHFSQAQNATICRGSCLFYTNHKNESWECFLKKKCHSYATISFLPELLKLKCASKSSGDLIKMQIWIQQLWDGA